MRHPTTGVLLAAAVVLAATVAVAGPARAAGPSCGDVVAADTTLTADLSCAGDALVVAAPGVTLDLGGHTVTGPGRRFDAFNTAVRVTAADVTVKNGTIDEYVYGVVAVAPRAHVTGLRLVRTEVAGIFQSDGNRFRGNLVVEAATGVRMEGDTNVTEGNAFRRTGLGVFTRGAGNRVAGNSITGVGHDVGIFVSSFSRAAKVSGNTVSGHAAAAGIFSTGDDTEVTGNRAFANLDGIIVSRGTVSGNLVLSNRRDGLLTAAGIFGGTVVVAANTAANNGELGIRGGPGAVDGGGNRASGNGDARQCTVVVCSP